MFAVAAEFAEVGCAESSRKIDAEVELGCDVVDGAHASRDTIECAAERLEALLAVVDELVAMQMAGVETQTAAQVEAFHEVLRSGGKDADVEKVVRGDEEFRAEVLRLLPHAVGTEVHGPSAQRG